MRCSHPSLLEAPDPSARASAVRRPAGPVVPWPAGPRVDEPTRFRREGHLARRCVRPYARSVTRAAVVLAEHEPEHREYLERHLRDDGFAVFRAGWNAQALDLAERVAPDVVIAAEAELCRRIRAGEPGRTWDRNVPLILLTDSHAGAADRK